MRIFVWLLRAAVFFALFAFALNNQHEAELKWFFGLEWRAPMVIVVLSAFGLGCAFGVLAMVPSWWRQRRLARRSAVDLPRTDKAGPPSSSGPDSTLPHPPRDGL